MRIGESEQQVPDFCGNVTTGGCNIIQKKYTHVKQAFIILQIYNGIDSFTNIIIM